jgi:hypothetical protein
MQPKLHEPLLRMKLAVRKQVVLFALMKSRREGQSLLIERTFHVLYGTWL